MKYIAYLSLVSCLILGAFSQAFADDYKSPELVDVTTPQARPESPDFQPTLGTYTYSVSWEGLPAAELVATVEQEGMNYKLTAKAKTYKAIDLFYKLRYNAEGLISSVDYSPLKTTIEHKENSRHKFTEIIFNPAGSVDTVRIDYKNEQIKTLSFDPENHMLDPFAASFLARSVKWDLGEERQFDTYNGQSRYLITLKAEEKTKIKVNGIEKEVWIISPTVKNLNYPEQNSKLRKAKIYVTADKSRDILKIVSSVFVGSVYTELDTIEPAPTRYFVPRFASNSDSQNLVK